MAWLNIMCCHALSQMGYGVFIPSWAPTNPAGRSQRGTCFCVVHVSVWSIRRSMTSQIGIDCEALWWMQTANSTPDGYQWPPGKHWTSWSTCRLQTTETPPMKQVLVSWTRLEKHEGNTDKFHNLMSLLLCVVFDQISLVGKGYHKYQKQTLPLEYLDHIRALNWRRHDFTQDPIGS